MRSFDETVTIEELYNAADYLDWLAMQENDHEATELDLHWQCVRTEIENEAYLNQHANEFPF